MKFKRDKTYLDGYGTKIRIVCIDKKGRPDGAVLMIGLVNINAGREEYIQQYDLAGRHLPYTCDELYNLKSEVTDERA